MNFKTEIMKKKILFNIATIFSLFLLVNCQEDNASFGDITTPTNLNINYEIVGKTASDPYGDGSGLVNFTATADNAISYKFDFGDNDIKSVPSGIF